MFACGAIGNNVADEEDVEVLAELEEDLEALSADEGGNAVLD